MGFLTEELTRLRNDKEFVDSCRNAIMSREDGVVDPSDIYHIITLIISIIKEKSDNSTQDEPIIIDVSKEVSYDEQNEISEHDNVMLIDTPDDEPMQETPPDEKIIEEAVEETPDDEPMQETPADEQIIEEAVEETPDDEPMKKTPADEQIIEEAVEETSDDEPMQETPPDEQIIEEVLERIIVKIIERACDDPEELEIINTKLEDTSLELASDEFTEGTHYNEETIEGITLDKTDDEKFLSEKIIDVSSIKPVEKKETRFSKFRQWFKNLS